MMETNTPGTTGILQEMGYSFNQERKQYQKSVPGVIFGMVDRGLISPIQGMKEWLRATHENLEPWMMEIIEEDLCLEDMVERFLAKGFVMQVEYVPIDEPA